MSSPLRQPILGLSGDGGGSNFNSREVRDNMGKTQNGPQGCGPGFKSVLIGTGLGFYSSSLDCHITLTHLG